MSIGRVSGQLLKFFLSKVSLSMLLYGRNLVDFWHFLAEAPTAKPFMGPTIGYLEMQGDTPPTSGPLGMAGSLAVGELWGSKRNTRRPEQ